MRSNGSAAEAILLEKVVIGGANIGCRLTRAAPCPRCGGANQTATHRYDECSDNIAAGADQAAEWLTKTAGLVREPGLQLDSLEVLWSRAIFSKNLAGRLAQDSRPLEWRKTWAANPGGAGPRRGRL